MSIIKTIAVRRNARIGIAVGIGIVIVALILAFCLPAGGTEKSGEAVNSHKAANSTAGISAAPTRSAAKTPAATPARSAVKSPAATATPARSAVQTPAATSGKAGQGIVIDKSKITGTATFIAYEVNGIQMEVIAVKDSKGKIRTALNTCQICFKSGKGYFVQEGKELVCQNCKNHFAIDKLGEAKNGCNPVPIPAQYRKEDSMTITISAEFLAQSSDLFKNWKK